MITHGQRHRHDGSPRPIAAAMTTLATAALVVACTPTGVVRTASHTGSATVLRVVDGDTIDVADDVRGRLRIRVLGIDTPETNKPGYSVGCWGPQASEYATATLLGARVAVISDPSQDAHDRYGRTLAYVEKAGGWDYSVEAVRSGAAHAYVYGHSPVARAPQIAAAEQEAKAAGRGLWGPPCYGHNNSQPLKQPPGRPDCLVASRQSSRSV